MSQFKKKKGKEKQILKVKTLITRDTSTTSVLKESSSEVKEGVGVGVLRPSAASPAPQASAPHPRPTSGKFPKSSESKEPFHKEQRGPGGWRMNGGWRGVTGDPQSQDSTSAQTPHIVSCFQLFSPLGCKPHEHKVHDCLAHCIPSTWNNA